MTVATWPTELPRPNVQGYSEQRANVRAFGSAQQGVPRVRRRWSNAGKPVSLVVRVDIDKRSIFDAFWEDVRQGTQPFWMPDPGRDETDLLTADGELLLTDDDAPLVITVNWLCLFGETPPRDTPVSGLVWDIGFDVTVLP